MELQRTSRRPTPQLTLLFVMSLWVLSPGPAAAQRTITLVGQVSASSGEAIGSRVTLRLEYLNGSLVDQRIGSSDGRFEFNGLDNVVYRMQVTAPGFQPWEKNIDLTGPRYYVSIEIVLFPVIKTTGAPANLPALTDEAAPRKARKEYEKGSHSLDENQPHEAQLHFEKAVAEYPCYARAQTDLARALILQNNISPAEAALKKSIACDGGYLDAYSKLGILFSGSKRYSESENILEEGLRRSPENSELHYQLAAAYSGLEQYAKAEAEYLKVRSLNPAAPAELHVKLADLYQRMQAYDKAFAEMRGYLQDDPEGRYAARIKSIMNRMESSGLIHATQTKPPQHQP